MGPRETGRPGGPPRFAEMGARPGIASSPALRGLSVGPTVGAPYSRLRGAVAAAAGLALEG